MRRLKALFALLILQASVFSLSMMAEGLFLTRMENQDYEVFLQLNLYEETIDIPGQPILGKTYGYLKKFTDSRVWIITDAEIAKDGKSAKLEMINDYGSEDLIATLSLNPDGTFTLKQEEGSTLKIAGKGKWIKLPKTLTFKVKK